MAVDISKPDFEKTIELSCRWVLAENLTKALPGLVDFPKIPGATCYGHQYLSSREVLSVVEQYFVV